MQGKEEAPPGLDMRAQQARNGGGGDAGGGSNNIHVNGRVATKASPRPQQRVFRGLPPRRNSNPLDSDSLSVSDDDENLVARDLEMAAATQTQTLRNSSSSGSKSTEPRATAGPSANVAVEEEPSTTSCFQPQVIPTTPSAKRKRAVFQEDSDSDDFSDADLADSDAERQLAAITDESARKQRQLQTQGLARSISQQVAGGTPPAATTRSDGLGGLEHNGGLPTPRTSRNSLLVKAEERERTAKKQRTVGFAALPGEEEGKGEEDGNEDQDGVVGDATTPTPYRKTDAFAAMMPSKTPTTPTRNRSAGQTAQAAPEAVPQTPGGGNVVPASTPTPATTPSSRSDYPKVADDVMSILVGQPISEPKRRAVEAALARHERLVKGVAAGRDAARAQLHARDARIAELQARVAALENARRMDRASLGQATEVLRRLTQQAQDNDEVEA